jgi:rare lipoprotein A
MQRVETLARRAWRRAGGAAILVATALLAACAGTPSRSPETAPAANLPPPAAPEAPLVKAKPPRAGNPPFYDVMGRRYHVLSSGEGYHERGVASWYGKEFHGRNTASGEPYDMHAFTAAHKTLPLPSYARVTNLRNGHSVIVRINDRGPFVRNRILDLSYAAAVALDITGDGTGIVDVVTIEPDDARDTLAGGEVTGDTPPIRVADSFAPEAPPPVEPPIEDRPLYVQVGAYGDPFNAERMHQRLASLGFDNVAVVPDIARQRPLYRVRLGPLPDVEAYDTLVDRLHAVAIDDIYLTLE